jgi:hypothetical protein
MLQKKPYSNQSNFSQRKAKKISSMYLIPLSVKSIKPRAKERRPFTITSWLSESHPLSTGALPCLRIHLALAGLFLDEDGFDDAQVHAEQAKSHALDNPYALGAAVFSAGPIWRRQRRFEDAASEALHAQEIFEKLGNLEVLRGPEISSGRLKEQWKAPSLR